MNFPEFTLRLLYVSGLFLTGMAYIIPGRGMNSAFAIGRLCDMETGRVRLLSLPESEKMVIY